MSTSYFKIESELETHKINIVYIISVNIDTDNTYTNVSKYLTCNYVSIFGSLQTFVVCISNDLNAFV